MAGHARCATCGRPAEPVEHQCGCGGRISFEYAYDGLRGRGLLGTGLGRYHALLPVHDAAVQMGEGGTPLVASRRLGPDLGIRLYFKLESLNPTGLGDLRA